MERDGGDSFGNRVVVITKCPKWTEIVAAIATAVPESHADKVTIPKYVVQQTMHALSRLLFCHFLLVSIAAN